MSDCRCGEVATIIIPHGFVGAGRAICGACAVRDYIDGDRSMFVSMVLAWDDLYPTFEARCMAETAA